MISETSLTKWKVGVNLNPLMMKYFALLITLAFAFSCDKSNVIQTETEFSVSRKSNADLIPNDSELGDTYKVHCEGPCDCGLRGDGKSASCKCDDCVMVVEIKDRKIELSDAEMEIPFLEDFNAHVQSLENYSSGDDVTINTIEVNSNESITAVRFEYTISASFSDDIIIVSELGDKYKIDCQGDCGCTAKFEFNPPAASCGCEDCVLYVESVD
jgi:hypothetical protein